MLPYPWPSNQLFLPHSGLPSALNIDTGSICATNIRWLIITQMNLRKKPQPQAVATGSDLSNQMSKMDDPVIVDRPNRREIAQAAKNLINFINDINKETREARKKRDRKQEEEIQKPEPVKKPKLDKSAGNVVHPPKQTHKPVEKPEVVRQASKGNELYRFTPENPFSIDGMDPTKKVNMPHGYPPYEFLLAQSQKLEGMPYMTPFDYITLQNLQAIPGMQGIQGLQGIQAMHGIHGLPNIYQMSPNKQAPFFYGNGYIRVPIMPQQMPQMPSIPQNMTEFRSTKMGEKKIFKRASYHVAIAYNIHIEKLKKKPEIEQMDEASIDPTYCARKMRQQNRGDNREVAREAEPAGKHKQPKE